MLARLDGLCQRLPTAAEALQREISAEFPSPIYSQIVSIIGTQVARLSKPRPR